MAKKKYKSEAFASIHETMEALYEIGAVDRLTMKEFDEASLVEPVLLTGIEIRSIREREHMSQPVFARHLRVSKNLLSDWERDVKKPGGPALLLLSLVKLKGVQAISLA